MSRTYLLPAALAATLTIVAGACGGGGSEPTAQVASLGTIVATATTAPASAADTQDALLAFAQCMRDNGVDMADPTFDADGNPTGGMFGPDSGIDPRSDQFQAAQETCGDLIEGITLGGPGQGGGLDRDAVQASMNDFTECLRDSGLDVDDIEFGQGQGPGGGGTGGFGGGPAPAAGGSVPTGSAPTGSVPEGGFQGGPPPGADGGPPDGEGFDPTARLIESLGLDADDPTVTAAIDSCQSILDDAFQPDQGTATTDSSGAASEATGD